MINDDDGSARELSGLAVPQRGSLRATGDPFAPFRLLDGTGVPVAAVSAFFAELSACGRPATTHRSYGMALLRWFRFLWAVGVDWGEATRIEARDFCRWLQVADKPMRPHWRARDADPKGTATAGPGTARPGTVNPVTGKVSPGRGYAAVTAAHCESVLRGFYDFHLEVGSGPTVNPFPMSRHRGGRHHNPMDPFVGQRSGRYRSRVVSLAPRCIPDARFDEVFARLGSHRDRALVAFWVSTGARAAELLGATAGDVDPGRQVITVVRKGTRVLQQLPASPDAFVWLRLYQPGSTA